MRCNAPGPEGPGCSATHTQNPTESHQVHPRAATGSLVLVCFRVGASVRAVDSRINIRKYCMEISLPI